MQTSTAYHDAQINQDVSNDASRHQKKLAWQDISEGFNLWRVWFMLANQDIKLRYRRSVLGPFWITLSMAITVYSMGFLYGYLFRQDLHHYYPYLVTSMLCWSLFASIANEICETFTSSDQLLKQIKLPYSLYIHRLITRNMLIFFHNILVIVPIYIIFHENISPNAYTLLFIPGLFLIYCNAYIYGLILAMLGARYRDISQITKSLIQVIFFITPILWSPLTIDAKYRNLLYYNPVYSFLELLRAPLLGSSPDFLNISITLLITLVGVFLCSKFFIRYRSRIIYWL